MNAKIAKFVNAKDIHRLLQESNPNANYSYREALKIKKIVTELYEKEFGQVKLFDPKRIPLSWVLHYFGEAELTPSNKKKTKSAS